MGRGGIPKHYADCFFPSDNQPEPSNESPDCLEGQFTIGGTVFVFRETPLEEPFWQSLSLCVEQGGWTVATRSFPILSDEEV